MLFQLHENWLPRMKERLARSPRKALLECMAAVETDAEATAAALLLTAPCGCSPNCLNFLKRSFGLFLLFAR